MIFEFLLLFCDLRNTKSDRAFSKLHGLVMKMRSKAVYHNPYNIVFVLERKE